MTITKLTEKYSRDLMISHLHYDIVSVFFSWMNKKFKKKYYNDINDGVISYDNIINSKMFSKFFESYNIKYLYQVKDYFQLNFPKMDSFNLFVDIENIYQEGEFVFKETLLKIGANISLTENEADDNIVKAIEYIRLYGKEAFKEIRKIDKNLLERYENSYINSFQEIFGINF